MLPMLTTLTISLTLRELIAHLCLAGAAHALYPEIERLLEEVLIYLL